MALQPFVDYLFAEKGNIGPMIDKVMRSLRRENG